MKGSTLWSKTAGVYFLLHSKSRKQPKFVSPGSFRCIASPQNLVSRQDMLDLLVACCEGKEKRRRFILSSKQPPQTEKRKKTRVKSIQAADLLVWLLSQLEQIPIYPNAHKFKVIKKKKISDAISCIVLSSEKMTSSSSGKCPWGIFRVFWRLYPTSISHFLERPTQKYFRPLKVKPNSDFLKLAIYELIAKRPREKDERLLTLFVFHARRLSVSFPVQFCSFVEMIRGDFVFFPSATTNLLCACHHAIAVH